MQSLRFEYLVDRPNDVSLVIDWWYSAWRDRMGSDREQAIEQLRASLGRDRLPIHILATLEGKAVGIAALKLQELIDLYPDKQYWLGSVFVDEYHRGSHIASDLSLKVAELATSRGLPQLYLQTVQLSGGLYRKLGWEPVERFTYKHEATLLMVKHLK